MNQTVNPFVNPDEDPKVGDVLDLAGDGGAYRIFMGNDVPGIGFELFHAQRDALVVRIDAEDHRFHLIPDAEDFGGMTNLLGPGHF